MNIVFIELGGNMGDKLQLISQAKNLVSNIPCEILMESSIYETPPWGFSANNNFFNQIIKVQTNLSADILLTELQSIELTLGRKRGEERYVSRTMDIDILFFNDDITDSKKLIIPHPRLHLRKFVLIPMAEIAPQLIHPVLNLSMKSLLSSCKDNSECKIMNYP